MIHFLKSSYLYFILLVVLMSHSLIINFISNMNKYILNNDGEQETEVNILKDENNYLKEEINKITKLSNFANYQYQITRLSYRDVKNKNIFYINGGSDQKFNNNYALVNELGLVGTIQKVKDTYSICQTIQEINDLSIKINNSYGTITKYQDGYLISKDFSNNDETNLNDTVYTSELGVVKENIKIGTIKKIENSSINKVIYIEPFVDFNNISYLYVIGG